MQADSRTYSLPRWRMTRWLADCGADVPEDIRVALVGSIALRDSNGIYRSWPVGGVQFTVQSPVDAHVEQFPKYTDDDVHNLMAYLQTLK